MKKIPTFLGKFLVTAVLFLVLPVVRYDMGRCLDDCPPYIKEGVQWMTGTQGVDEVIRIGTQNPGGLSRLIAMVIAFAVLYVVVSLVYTLLVRVYKRRPL